jgi:hypothetical protein
MMLHCTALSTSSVPKHDLCSEHFTTLVICQYAAVQSFEIHGHFKIKKLLTHNCHTYIQLTAHQTIHFGLRTAVISWALALLLNYECIMLPDVYRTYP